MTQIAFMGAAGTVTGSKYLLTNNGRKVLIDCGLFQGFKNLRELNWQAFGFTPSDIEAVVLTHAHLDHSGALPLLFLGGFRGSIYATSATIQSLYLLLPDSGHLQEEQVKQHRERKSSKHQSPKPLYTEEDARRVLTLLKSIPFNQYTEVAPGISVCPRTAGHILGAASLYVRTDTETVLFSGDLGRNDDAVMLPPAPIAEPVDYVLMESTYGNRVHQTDRDGPDNETLLGEIINRTAKRGGSVVIPAFAVGRAQMLLHFIAELKVKHAIPTHMPVYLDSPMAISVTDMYRNHLGEHRLSLADCDALHEGVKMTRTPDESRAITAQHSPCIVISASGMMTGGRILHHIEHFGPHPRNTIVLVGYQAGGTRGAKLAAGEKMLRIYGEDVPIRAEVVTLHSMSAHADATQLTAWLGSANPLPKKVFLVHGEPDATDALRLRVERALHVPVTVPLLNQCVELSD